MRFLPLSITLSCLSRGNSVEIPIDWTHGIFYQDLVTVAGNTVLVHAKTNECHPGFSVIEFNDVESYNQCTKDDYTTFKELSVTDCKISISLDNPGQKFISTREKDWCTEGMKFKITTKVNDGEGDCNRDSFEKRNSQKCNLVNTIAFYEERGTENCAKECCNDSRCVSLLAGKGRCFLFDDRKKPKERIKYHKPFRCHVKKK